MGSPGLNYQVGLSRAHQGRTWFSQLPSWVLGYLGFPKKGVWARARLGFWKGPKGEEPVCLLPGGWPNSLARLKETPAFVGEHRRVPFSKGGHGVYSPRGTNPHFPGLEPSRGPGSGPKFGCGGSANGLIGLNSFPSFLSLPRFFSLGGGAGLPRGFPFFSKPSFGVFPLIRELEPPFRASGGGLYRGYHSPGV